MNACLLDFLLANKALIPSIWKGGRYVYFPATKYRDSDGALCLRCLYWNDGQWNWNYNWLDNHWDDQNPAAILASLFISHSAYRRGRFVF